MILVLVILTGVIQQFSSSDVGQKLWFQLYQAIDKGAAKWQKFKIMEFFYLPRFFALLMTWWIIVGNTTWLRWIVTTWYRWWRTRTTARRSRMTFRSTSRRIRRRMLLWTCVRMRSCSCWCSRWLWWRYVTARIMTAVMRCRLRRRCCWRRIRMRWNVTARHI